MRIRTYTAAAGCAVAVVLAASGCTSADSGNAADGSSTSASASASANASTGASPTASSAQGAQAAAGGECQAANLTFKLGLSSLDSTESAQVVDLTNSGSTSCTMDGFPGVDLVGVADGQTSYTWSLVRQSISYSPVTLQPGGTAHFDIHFLPDSSGAGDIVVTKFVVTPPNTYTQAQVTWSQSIVLQDAATHPGTYISPIISGA